MVQSIKVLLFLLILGYLGYVGWKNYTEGAPLPTVSSVWKSAGGPQEPLTRKEKEALSKEEAVELERKIEKMPPFQQISLELDQVADRVFASLKSGANSDRQQLESLWKKAESEFKSGKIKQGDAAKLAQMIKTLNDLSRERGLFYKRYLELNKVKETPFDSGMSAKEKKAFAEKELNRQWQEWVGIHRPVIHRQLKSLSD